MTLASTVNAETRVQQAAKLCTSRKRPVGIKVHSEDEKAEIEWAIFLAPQDVQKRVRVHLVQPPAKS